MDYSVVVTINLLLLESFFIPLLNVATPVRNMHLWGDQVSGLRS